MNKQVELWMGKFGDGFSVRDDYLNWEKHTGVELEELLKEFFKDIPKHTSILDTGCNIGYMIQMLKDLGYTNLSGIDINDKTIQLAKKSIKGVRFWKQDIKIPLLDNFDLVIHSAILVHVHPSDLEDVMKSIYTMSNKYIFGKEMSTPKPTDIGEMNPEWRDQLWTQRFCRKWMKLYPNLKLKKFRLINPRVKQRLETEVFLLEK